MADTLLTNTLQGTTPITPQLPVTPKALTVPDLTGNNPADIKTLGAAQQQPSAIMNLQKAMQNASRVAYNERQTSELGALGQQFDPSKVSGGTFASIVGNLEQRRGTDVSKVYASTMNAYASAQEQITSRLQYLQELEEQKRQFEENLKLEKERIKELKKQNKEEAKRAKKQLDEDTRRWNMEYALSKAKANTQSSAASVYTDIGTSRAQWQSSLQNNSSFNIGTYLQGGQ